MQTWTQGSACRAASAEFWGLYCYRSTAQEIGRENEGQNSVSSLYVIYWKFVIPFRKALWTKIWLFFLKEINILWLNSPEFLQRFKIDTFLTVISSQKEVVGYISAEIMLSSHLLYIYIHKDKIWVCSLILQKSYHQLSWQEVSSFLRKAWRQPTLNSCQAWFFQTSSINVV